jgi:imidazolonepropionase-like amidohydrolase
MIKTIATIAAAALCSAAAAQDLTTTAPAQSNPVFLVGATVHTGTGEVIENGVVSFSEGRIGLVGKADDIMPRVRLTADTQVIDLSGKHGFPGVIGAVTMLGLDEISAVRAMRDFDEVGDATPEVRAYVAVNPDSTLIPVARTNGVLTAGVFPTGGLIPGRASVISMEGWTNEDMAIDRDAGVIINWPSMRPRTNRFDQADDEPDTGRIDERLAALDGWFDQAEAYRKSENAPADLRLQALTTVLPGAEGQNPVFINADDYDQIVAAVNWAATRGLRPVIVGGRDAGLCTDLLKAHDAAVIISGVHRFPKRADSAFDDAFTLPARLENAGVRWCLASGAETGHERNLIDNAAMAVAYGLPIDAGLRSITASAADILGVGDQLGTIENGKRATLIVTDGHALEVTSTVEHAFIDGRKIDLSNKQTELRDKYREKYRQLGVTRED